MYSYLKERGGFVTRVADLARNAGPFTEADERAPAVEEPEMEDGSREILAGPRQTLTQTWWKRGNTLSVDNARHVIGYSSRLTQDMRVQHMFR